MEKHTHPAKRNGNNHKHPTLAKVAATVDMRKIRAYFVAAFYIIISMGRGVFQVSRPDGSATYKVEVRKRFHSCSCDDALTRRGAWCKHALAIPILLAFFGRAVKSWKTPYEIPLEKRPEVPPGAEAAYYEGARRRRPVVRVFPPGTPCESTRRNNARSEMPKRSVELLWMLCQRAFINKPPTVKPEPGRPGLPIVLRLFVVVFRLLRNTSYDIAKETLGQYLGSTVRMAGAINPSKNSWVRYVHNPALTELLYECLRLTARVVRNIEKAIVIDATAFSTCQTENWLDSNYGKKRRRKHNLWIKGHAATGAYTNVVVSLLTSTNENQGSADTNFFDRLLKFATKVWDLKWVLADKGYLSEDNIQAANARNLRALIPIVSTWKIENARSEEMRKLINLYRNDNATFQEKYRYRTKIESVFSAIKRTTGYHSRTRFRKADVAEALSDVQFVGRGRINELLAKCVTHNLRQLVRLEHLHADRVNFDADRAFEPLPTERDDDDPFDMAA
jgi:hypothetical protein